MSGERLSELSTWFSTEMCPKFTTLFTFLTECKDFEEGNPLSAAITRLASVERGIERRYLKPPLRQE